MGWQPRPAEIDAVRQYAVGGANAILQGETSAYEGAKLLWLMSIELGLMEEALRTFAGLASEWEDAPERRDEVRERNRCRSGQNTSALWAVVVG
jgi:hypothetical protein